MSDPKFALLPSAGGEPVAFRVRDHINGGWRWFTDVASATDWAGDAKIEPLFATPPPGQPEAATLHNPGPTTIYYGEYHGSAGMSGGGPAWRDAHGVLLSPQPPPPAGQPGVEALRAAKGDAFISREAAARWLDEKASDMSNPPMWRVAMARAAEYVREIVPAPSSPSPSERAAPVAGQELMGWPESISTAGNIVTRTDLIARLSRAGEHLGNAIAGYRDSNNHRAAKGVFEAATAMMDAKAFLETAPPADAVAQIVAWLRANAMRWHAKGLPIKGTVDEIANEILAGEWQGTPVPKETKA